ncbi:MAG TPA: family 78 glycoside hydrolase catalytic domain, partial [Fimbriimonadaceae bacterium]|nr:family 78 glycoside hydrolase catalytic domain [Fimbriimonadaceae bacterium]
MTIPLLTLAASVAGTLAPTALRCECLTDPLAIDRTEPELSWKVREARAGLKNLRQTAYRVLVASAPEILEKDRGDLWDSGKVQSAETYGIVYAGLPLKSRQRCWWKVKVWDQDGDESSWSEPAKFRMGLLSPSDWTAKWIGIDAPDRLSPEGERFSGANWIWSKTDQQGKVPKVTRTFIRTFAADPEALESAVLNITVDDQFVLFLNGTEVARSDGQPEAWRRAHRLDLLPLLKKGENELRVDATNDGETASGVLAKLVLDRKQGSSQIIVTDESWQEPNGPGVTVIAPFTGGPWGNFGAITLRGATYYRREFRTKAKVTRATAYVTALGLVDLHVNGKRVNEALFTPGWTDYDKRVYYRSFDISAVVQEGQNCVGVVLGDGWYSGYVGFGAKRAHYGERPRVLAQIELELEDGSREIIGTDESWLASTGPTLEQDFLMGETYDARLAKPWCEASFKAEGWIRSDTHEAPKAVLQAFPAEPVLPYKELQPISIKKLPSGAYLLDFGQNLAGFLKLKLKGRRGQEITLRHGEWLNPDGTLYTTNLRAARATDLYICGGEEEEWSPRFTFHGFQYAEISGLDQEPKA